jgi:DAK2 domain fusion protein YloV
MEREERGGPAPTEPVPTTTPLDAAATVWDGPAFVEALAAGATRLEAHRRAVDDLNVFPVPDGDTGSNMSATAAAAVAGARASLAASRAVGEVAAAAARNALLDARGNSGVLLAQILQGIAAATAKRTAIDGRDLATAFAQASDVAYRAMVDPVEGTILTVIRAAAEHAARAVDAAAASAGPTPAACLAAALTGAEVALADTPRLLPILGASGVVDAGGQGLVHLLAGMASAARGEPVIEGNHADDDRKAGDLPGAAMPFLDQVAALHGDDPFGYCTNFLVHLIADRAHDLERCRRDLAAMGTSAVIVGDDRALKVHIHTVTPHEPLAYGLALGELDQIKIDNMALQTAALQAQRAASAAPDRIVQPPQTVPDARAISIAVVAVAAGDGLADALRGMGADTIVAGGQTMNPSVRDLLSAVEGSAAADVLLLPNNPNVVLTADQVSALTAKRVAVVPSRSLPQGLAALARFSADDPLAANQERMTAALAAVRTAEVTTATRDATVDGVRVSAGDLIGLVDDRLVATGRDPLALVRETLAHADLAAAELVTIFPGHDAPPAEADALQAALRAAHPALAVEIHAGDQPHYRYVIAVE